MNFVAQVEDHLRDLGAEARKTHPAIKESSERAIMHLRSLQTQYVAAVRRAGASKSPSSPTKSASASSSASNSKSLSAHPTTALFSSHEILRPFLLTLSTPEASLNLTCCAMDSIQLLLRGDAVRRCDGREVASVLFALALGCAETVGGAAGGGAGGGGGIGGVGSGGGAGGVLPNLWRTDRILTLSQRARQEDESVAFKILQTMTMLVDSRSVELTSEVVGACLGGCLVLGGGDFQQSQQEGGNVRRAALATMNQILSILFERGRDEMFAKDEVEDEGVMDVTCETLMDLCGLVYNYMEKNKREIRGPLSMSEGMVPSPTTCLSLIDMIFKQRGGDFFVVCGRYFDGVGFDANQKEIPPNVQFSLKSIQETCQFVLSILQMQHSKPSLEVSSDHTSASDSTAFSFFYYASSLGSTILTNYLSPSFFMHHEKFDAMQLLAANTQETIQRMSHNALKMIQLLVGFVSRATDAYHKSEFEDGYMFNQTERESLNIGKDDGAPATMDDSMRRKSAVQTVVTQATPDPLVSNDQLWRAFLSLEVIYCLLCLHLEQIVLLDLACQKDEKLDETSQSEKTTTIISSITKAASDLATISGSNRERILHVILIAHDDKSTVGDPSSAAASLAEKFSDSQLGRSGDVPVFDTGLATWLSYKCVLALVKSLKTIVLASNESNNPDLQQSNARQILIECFAPSVSVLQHYIKRMSGSHVVISETLKAYENLAYASMVLDSLEENLRRHAILTSLCKLCLPSWGKNRAHSQLKESNIDSLWVLLRIVHEQFDHLYDEWHTILSTLNQLAILSIKSSKLPNSYSSKASAIAESLARLPKFTTCFSDEALAYFVTSLVSLSKLVSLSPLVEQSSIVISRQNSESFDYGDGKDDSINGRESISGKLISFAGRSLGFGGGSTQPAASNATIRRANSVDSAAPQLLFSKVYSDDLREDVSIQLISMKVSTPRAAVRKLPLPLLLLCVVAEANSYRFKVVEEMTALHLCDIVSKSTAPEYRTFAMEVLIHFIPLSLNESPIIHCHHPISAPKQQDIGKPLEIVQVEQNGDEIVADSPTSKNKMHLLTILCNTMRQSQQPETAETGLNALHIVLEGSCQNLSGDNLVDVIGTLSALSGFSASDSGEPDSVDRSTKSWSTVSTKSFQVFKLIFDDFLEPTESESPDLQTDSLLEREAIVNCCVSFGKSRHDVNTSLTATGMLWSLADQNPTPDTLDLVLSKLSYLALDERPELRNCAVNTLISCAVGRGHQFTNEQWRRALNQTIFGIMKDISGAINDKHHNKIENGSTERYKVAVHHSRDSATKQWSTTLVLTLRGLERVLRLFFPQLLASTMSTSRDDEEIPWFVFTWKEILKISLESATLQGGRETLDIRLAGIELITLCSQLSCVSGMVASANSARVGTNMEVIGGALRSVREANAPEEEDLEVEKAPLEPEVDEWRMHLFDLSLASLVVDFRDHLECAPDSDESSDHYMIDSVSTQVLNKLVGELAKLYECCKNDEMLPGSCELRLDILAEDDGSNESRFINLLIAMVEKSPGESSRYLNQVQRGVMTLLQSMASHSSLRALKALTSLSGDRIFVRSQNLNNSDNNSDRGEGEVFELEAAKTISNVFASSEMVDEVRIVVMCSVLSQYLKLYGNPEIAGENSVPRKASEARYDFFISVIDSGVEAVAHLDDEYNGGNSVLDAIWDRILDAVTSILMPPPLNRFEAYIYHSKSFLNIVALVLHHIPKRKYSQAELMLEKGAHRAVEVAFECNTDSSPSALKIIDGAFDVFLACFMGLCQKMPASIAVGTLTNEIFSKAETEKQQLPGSHLRTDKKKSAKEDPSCYHLISSVASPIAAKTQQSLALAVCESLKASDNEDLLVGLFPMLCQLTNVENDSLRRAAGAVLAGVNISEAILRERQRAEEAETKAKEIEEENNALLEEVDYLQAENEELQRQLAVFSESSDFT